MKIFYRIFILLITFLLLTTFNPGEINFFPNKSKNYFSINKIEITNNQLISKNDINEKLKHVYKKNIRKFYLLQKKHTKFWDARELQDLISDFLKIIFIFWKQIPNLV